MREAIIACIKLMDEDKNLKAVRFDHPAEMEIHRTEKEGTYKFCQWGALPELWTANGPCIS